MGDKVYPQNLWAWAAFHALRGSRQIGMDLGPIPISEIAAYSDFIGLTDPMQRQRLARFVMALDRTERQHGKTGP